MHGYSIDTDDRERWLALLLFPSAVIGWIISRLISLVPNEYIWWIDVPSVLGSYQFFRWLFTNHAWRWLAGPPLGWVKWHSVPDLNGIWEGSYRSSYVDSATGLPKTDSITVEIKQTWNRICIVYRARESRSDSKTATILSEQGTVPILHYEYENQPHQLENAALSPHPGVAHLELQRDANGEKLEGGYYSGGTRRNEGRLVFRRTSD